MKKGTAVQDFCSCNILTAEVSTNCPQGGDAGHGGATALRLKNDSGTCWRIAVDGAVVENFREMVLELGGDSECETFIDALEWAAAELRKQQEANLRAGAPLSLMQMHVKLFTEDREAALSGRAFKDPFSDDE